MARNYKKLPRVALAGRRNVGKSTLLNALYGRKRAITDSIAGLTRDILEVEVIRPPFHFLLSDTPGLDIENPDQLESDLLQRAFEYIKEIDLLLLVLEAPAPGPFDLDFITLMRRNAGQTPVLHVVNKVDGAEKENESLLEFYGAGIQSPIAVSAIARWNLKGLMEQMAVLLPGIKDPALPESAAAPGKGRQRRFTNQTDASATGFPAENDVADVGIEDAIEWSAPDESDPDLLSLTAQLEQEAPESVRSDLAQLSRSRYAERKEAGIRRSSSIISDTRSAETRIAIVGRPNAGKSSLFNRLLKKDTALVSDVAGTTRDTIDTVFKYQGRELRIVDTAGLKRGKARQKDQLEFYSASRTWRAIRDSRVVIHMVDASEGLTEYDKKIAAKIRELSRPVVMAFNKWDAVADKHDRSTLEYLDRYAFQFPYIRNMPAVFCSALSGQRLTRLLDICLDLDQKMQTRIPTGSLNQQIQAWLRSGPTSSRKLRVYYVAQIETEPPAIVFFVNRKEYFRENLRNYIENRIRKAWQLEGVPIEILIRQKGSSRDEDDNSTSRGAN
ncbi:MAG: ribosome biogenesis GTPase Der [Leptospiraceae bacterium]|nr:ribosome biogenesis GTPase Der [Leptospiraceae bacterium]